MCHIPCDIYILSNATLPRNPCKPDIWQRRYFYYHPLIRILTSLCLRSKKVLLLQVRPSRRWWMRWKPCMQQHLVLSNKLNHVQRPFSWHLFPIARGDQKRAKARLRAGNTRKSHHFSAFRSGLYVGLATPALAVGLFNGLFPSNSLLIVRAKDSLALSRQTHQTIPAWAPLLFVYGVFLIPVVFSFLLGINLLVWSNAQINYSFIFGEHFFHSFIQSL